MKIHVASAVAPTALIVGLGGARADALRTPIVSQSLSDADIENLAAYYSAIGISVGKTPAQ